MKWIEDGVYFVSQPRRSNHIGHFSEAVNPILLKFRYPLFYLPCTDWYIPQFGKNEFEWTSTYLKLLYGLFKNNHKPTLRLINNITLDSLTCFVQRLQSLVHLIIVDTVRSRDIQ